jgi:hypothetical protein
MRLTLLPHPHSAAPPVEITVDLGRAGAALALSFCLTGDLDGIAIPARTVSERTGNLWQTSCFEVFIRKESEHGYLEFNLSPSTRWAAYAFDDYRAGMRDADIQPPSITMARDATLTLATVVQLPAGIADSALRIGLSAIVEGRDGSKSWYALAHPDGAPDFHHADCFALGLAARTAP